MESKYITNHVLSSEVLRVPNYTNYSSVIISAEAIKHLTKGSDVSIKPIRNTSLSGRVVSTSWRAIPLNRPAQRQGTQSSKTREQIFEVSTWKTMPQARLSILILSKTCKAFWLVGFVLPKMPLNVNPYFQILFSHLSVGLTILSLHLTLHKHSRAII